MLSAAEPEFSLRLERSMRGLAELGSWVDQVTAALHLPKPQEYALRLCLEEAVANVVMHGAAAPGVPADAVAVKLCSSADALHVVIEDDCAAFNPLHHAAPSLPPGLDQPPGGWGIQLMRQFASSMAYQRVGETNRLALTIGRDVE